MWRKATKNPLQERTCPSCLLLQDLPGLQRHTLPDFIPGVMPKLILGRMSRPEAWQVWWAELTLELPTGLAEPLLSLLQSLTSSSALCCFFLISFHRYWCLFVNTVYPKLCLSVCPWKTQKEGRMMSQQEPGHTNLVKDLGLYSKSHWKPSRVLSRQRSWFDSRIEKLTLVAIYRFRKRSKSTW